MNQIKMDSWMILERCQQKNQNMKELDKNMKDKKMHT